MLRALATVITQPFFIGCRNGFGLLTAFENRRHTAVRPYVAGHAGLCFHLNRSRRDRGGNFRLRSARFRLRPSMGRSGSRCRRRRRGCQCCLNWRWRRHGLELYPRADLTEIVPAQYSHIDYRVSHSLRCGVRSVCVCALVGARSW